MRFVPADVRAFTAYLQHALMQVLSALLVLVFAPVLYMVEKFHRRQQEVPSSYNHVLITGASSGAGEGLCHAYAKPGTRVILVARTEEQLTLVARKCRELGATTHVEVMDVTDQAGMQAIVDRAEKVAPLDLVIAVAGHEASMSKDEDIVSASRQAVQVNFLGMLNTILPAIPYMRARRRGQLVLFSSQLGYFAAPLAADYDSCKVAIRLYGEGLRSILWRDNVGVTVITPGGMITPMMNSLTERAKMPFVVYMLPIPNAVKFMVEGIRRNEAVVAFPSALTAFTSAIGAWPSQLRSMVLTLITSDHHVKWRLGEVPEYKPQANGKKQDEFYAKERKAETIRQKKGGMSSLDQ